MESWRGLLLAFQRHHGDEQSDKTYTLLKQLVKGSIDEDNRCDVTDVDLGMLSTFLSVMLKHVLKESVSTDNEVWKVITEGVKLFRNLAAGVCENQFRIINDSILLSQVLDLCTHLSTLGEMNFDLLKISLQLLGNLCVGCPEGQERVWLMCYPRVFSCVLQCGQPEAINVCCMIIYTCLRANSSYRTTFRETTNGTNLIGQFLSCLATIPGRLDWIEFLLEHLVITTPLGLLWQHGLVSDTPTRGCLDLLLYLFEKLSDFTTERMSVSMYTNSTSVSTVPCRTGSVMSDTAGIMDTKSTSSRHGHTVVGDLIEHSDISDKQATVKSIRIPCDQSTVSSDDELYRAVTNSDNSLFLQQLFTEHAQYMLDHDAAVLVRVSCMTGDDGDLLKVKLTACLLKILNCLSQAKCCHGDKDNVALLSSVLALLKQLSVMDGSFDSGRHRSRLAKTSPTGNEKFHPLFGFKRDLVRLVANLSYKNVDVQDRVNTLGAVPLILNQCSIDHCNPYITQWSVLAIRNLCEQNATNQKLIASLERQGTANAQQLLDEFGCEVEIGEDGKMKVKGAVRK